MGLLVIGGKVIEIPEDEDEILEMADYDIFKMTWIGYQGQGYEFIAEQKYNVSWFMDKPQLLKEILNTQITDKKSGEKINIARIIKRGEKNAGNK